MKILLKYKLEIFLFLVLLVIYFVSRIPNLTLQPIFADEAIYIRWAQVMRAEPTLRFVSLSDGKTPLFMWLMIPFLKFFSDPLLAGRFLSVICGALTIIGMFAIGLKFFDKKIAFWAMILYIVTPFALFFDRMALVDSMLSTFTIWSLFLGLWLVTSPRLDLSMILGFTMGAGILTKTPGMVNLISLPLATLSITFFENKLKLIKLVGFILLSILIAFGIYNLLRLGPEFGQLSKRNGDYMFTVPEFLSHPLDPFVPHIGNVTDFFGKLVTWPILSMMAVGLFFVIKKFDRKMLVVTLWGVLPLLVEMAILKTFTARYLLLCVPPLLILASFGLENMIKLLKLNQTSALLLMIIVISNAVVSDQKLLTDPASAPLPREERAGYFEQWTAGYGLKDIANYLIEQRKTSPVVVGTEGFFGTLPDGLYIYLDKANISVIGERPEITQALIKSATDKNKVFYVANRSRIQGSLDNAVLIKEYPKAVPLDGSKQDAIVLYQVLK